MALFFLTKTTSFWSSHEVELKYLPIPIDPHCRIFCTATNGLTWNIFTNMQLFISVVHVAVSYPLKKKRQCWHNTVLILILLSSSILWSWDNFWFINVSTASMSLMISKDCCTKYTIQYLVQCMHTVCTYIYSQLHTPQFGKEQFV